MLCEKCGTECISEILDSEIVFTCKNRKCTFKKSITVKNRSKEMKLKNIAKSNKNLIIVSNIKKLRFLAGNEIGQGDISKCLNLSAQRYGAIERCDNIPTAIKLMEIAEVFKVTLNELYTKVYLTEEEYIKLTGLVAVYKDKDSFNLEEKAILIENDKKIKDYIKDNNIVDRRILKNVDDKKTIEIKQQLQKMESDYTSLRKDLGAILKQKKVIDYYHWEQAKKMIGYSEQQHL